MFREEYIVIEDFFFVIKKRVKVLTCEYENIYRVFVKVFWRMDRFLRFGRKEVFRVRWSGCFVVICILEGNIENFFVKNWRRINDYGGLVEKFFFLIML